MERLWVPEGDSFRPAPFHSLRTQTNTLTETQSPKSPSSVRVFVNLPSIYAVYVAYLSAFLCLILRAVRFVSLWMS